MVTVKLKPTEAAERFKNSQSGTVTYSLEDFYKIYVFEKAYKEFIKWTGREVVIAGQGRTSEYNKSVNGNANSSHLKALSRDTYFKNTDLNEERVIKYMKTWKTICEKYGFIGECGFYPKYVNGSCKGMLHIGGFVNYSKSFTNWRTDGTQKTNYYKL